MTENPIARDDANALAQPFSAMAAQIVHNGAGTFGGAFVIVPPGADGRPVTVLVLDPHQDPVMFWASAKSKIESVLSELELAQRQNASFRR